MGEAAGRLLSLIVHVNRPRRQPQYYVASLQPGRRPTSGLPAAPFNRHYLSNSYHLLDNSIYFSDWSLVRPVLINRSCSILLQFRVLRNIGSMFVLIIVINQYFVR